MELGEPSSTIKFHPTTIDREVSPNLDQMEENMPTYTPFTKRESLRLGVDHVPLSTLIANSKLKKKKKWVRYLKIEIKEMQVL